MQWGGVLLDINNTHTSVISNTVKVYYPSINRIYKISLDGIKITDLYLTSGSYSISVTANSFTGERVESKIEMIKITQYQYQLYFAGLSLFELQSMSKNMIDIYIEVSINANTNDLSTCKVYVYLNGVKKKESSIYIKSILALMSTTSIVGLSPYGDIELDNFIVKEVESVGD